MSNFVPVWTCPCVFIFVVLLFSQGEASEMIIQAQCPVCMGSLSCMLMHNVSCSEWLGRLVHAEPCS